MGTHTSKMAQPADKGELILPVLESFHDWARLPDELKCEVLSHNLTLDGEINDKNMPRFYSRICSHSWLHGTVI